MDGGGHAFVAGGLACGEICGRHRDTPFWVTGDRCGVAKGRETTPHRLGAPPRTVGSANARCSACGSAQPDRGDGVAVRPRAGARNTRAGRVRRGRARTGARRSPAVDGVLRSSRASSSTGR
ncbi:hypothetical protein GCM10022215_32480 [Nocardioides fonticola]|uniref:Uncharacterized protein n=1 Tax=Nocardioides fonticola TaxID=450363 RepID=A0ABP7XS98_9ACTN